MQIKARAVGGDQFPQKMGAAIAQAGGKAAELVACIGQRHRIGAGHRGGAGKPACGMRVQIGRVKAQRGRRKIVQHQKLRRGCRIGGKAQIAAGQIAGIAVVEMMGHAQDMARGIVGCKPLAAPCSLAGVESGRGARDFELSTYGTQNRRATRLRYAPTDAPLACFAAKGKRCSTALPD